MTSKFENLSTDELKKEIQVTEKNFSTKNIPIFCPNHDLEIYLYGYYINRSDYNTSDSSLHKMYEELATRMIKSERYKEADNYLDRAATYNSTDIEIIEKQAFVCRKTGDLDKLVKVVNNMYPFCYTRRDIASFYRIVATYHIDKYQPEIARVLLLFSNIYMESNAANQELLYLETALKDKTPEYTIEELQKYLEKYKYPLQPKEETLAFLYRVGDIEKAMGNVDYAKYLYSCLYELTADMEVGKILQEDF